MLHSRKNPAELFPAARPGLEAACLIAYFKCSQTRSCPSGRNARKKYIADQAWLRGARILSHTDKYCRVSWSLLFSSLWLSIFRR